MPSRGPEDWATKHLKVADDVGDGNQADLIGTAP